MTINQSRVKLINLRIANDAFSQLWTIDQH